MAALASNNLPFLAKPSTGWDLFSKPPERPTSYPHLPSDDGETIGPKRIIASRRTEIFVGKGNEVRCADLQDLKARQPTGAQQSKEGYREYKTLDLPDLDFDIHQLEISKDGLFLAIVGEKELAVCVLPAEGLSRMENPKLRVPAFHAVGKNYHNTDGSRIVRAVWHPLGVDGASLVVLSTDGMVRTYDFTIGQEFTFDIPDQTLDLYALCGQKRHVGGFYADQEEMEPASCCFGEGQQGWRPFTLYILMRGGDIYALTPLVPSRWKASRDYLQNLSLDITADLESLEETATIQEKLMLRQQTKWINDVLNQEANLVAALGAIPGSPRKKVPTYLTRPEVVGPSPKLQGPFLFQPAPLEFSGDYYACDIFHIEAGAIGVIGILFSNGKVDICLEFELLRARWVDKKKRMCTDEEKTVDLPIIAAYESINLDIPAGNDSTTTNWPVFVSDPRSEHVWYVNHNSGVVSFSMKAWLSKLATVMDDDEEDGFMAKLLEKNSQSTVQKVIDHGKRPVGIVKPIFGSVVVYEAYLGYILIAATPTSVESAEFDEVLAQISRSDAFGVQAQSFREATTPQRNAALHLAQYTASPSAIQKKTSILSPPYVPSPEFRKSSALPVLLRQGLAYNSKLIRSPIVFSTESNEFLRKARDTLKVEYDRIMEAAQEMYDRSAMQRIEYRKQLETIHKASENLEKLRNKDVRERLERYLKKQEELQTRADDVLKLLIMRGEIGLSDAEKKWFKEVGKIEERVEGDGRSALAGRKDQVEKMLEQLCPMIGENGEGELKRRGLVMESRDGIPEEVRAGKLKQLRELLDREDALVKATKERLENLFIEVEHV